jgi:hypothetical protein
LTEPGYVYALINYSMPGLLKIGRTTRPPSNRGEELSAATGVPTPFVLLFDIFVPDSAEAERQIHFALETAGFRHARGREFFSVPPDLAVRLLLAVRDGADTPPVRLPRRLLGRDFSHLSDAGRKVADALCRLGYEAGTVAHAVERVTAEDAKADFGELVRRALQQLEATREATRSPGG